MRAPRVAAAKGALSRCGMTRARRAQRGFPHRIFVAVLTRCCRQSQAVQERQATVDSLNGKLMDGKRAKVALEERTLQEVAAIEESTANAAEERKRAAELLVAVSRQVRRLCALSGPSQAFTPLSIKP